MRLLLSFFLMEIRNYSEVLFVIPNSQQDIDFANSDSQFREISIGKNKSRQLSRVTSVGVWRHRGRQDRRENPIYSFANFNFAGKKKEKNGYA